VTITLDIRPETQDELARQAAARGMELEVFAASLLEQAAHDVSVRPAPSAAAKDMVELFAPFEASTSILSATETRAGISTCKGHVPWLPE
jgi:predicted RNA-binding Zn ribbon-like protein